MINKSPKNTNSRIDPKQPPGCLHIRVCVRLGALLAARPFRAVLTTSMATSAKTRVTAPQAPATAEQKTSQEAKRLPVKTFRIDDCSATIWDRIRMVQGKSTTFYSITFERAYKDRDGDWKYTKSFDLESLGKVVMLCQQASEFIHALQQKDAA